MAAIDDYKKFLASKPAAQREYRTLEIYHPNALPVVLRFVQDFVDRTLTLESDAPRNAGASVTFTALAMQITEPAEDTTNPDSVLNVSLGVVNNSIQDWLNTIDPLNNLTPIEIIYRKFYSGNLTEPVRVLYFSASSVTFEGYEKNTIIAENSSLTARKSGELYTLERFPTLVDI